MQLCSASHAWKVSLELLKRHTGFMASVEILAELPDQSSLGFESLQDIAAGLILGGAVLKNLLRRERRGLSMPRPVSSPSLRM